MPFSNLFQLLKSKLNIRNVVKTGGAKTEGNGDQEVAIAIIYHPKERFMTEYWENQLVRAGYKVRLAPLGLEVNSESWKQAISSDIKDSSFVLVLLTSKSIKDDSVAWRVREAKKAKKLTIPIAVEEHIRHTNETLLPEIFDYNWLSATSDDQRESALKHLLSFLPKVKPSAFCFISYSHADEAFAIKLRKDLIEHGIKVWRDADDIPAGSMWDAAIQEALNKSSHLLIILTPKSVQSQNVADEIGFALDKNKVIIPLLLQEVELPLRIHRAQYIDFREDYESALARLVDRIDV